MEGSAPELLCLGSSFPIISTSRLIKSGFITGVKTSCDLVICHFVGKGKKRFSCSFLAHGYKNALLAGDLFVYFKSFDNLKNLSSNTFLQASEQKGQVIERISFF